ncbi:OLC1v1038899C1 [Oldenlandia corymbosa var. corymbosa]|uniref:OLC1v1038899C1 n=1 Tax=Oldenlandia corymbosa var. corymbosa TaxID=529605 RepID=A0AAV1D333_OLDCO|nr:OLC1v1038899C1 [Oldenlandia corymbosa var. corymbosa]
MSTFNTERSKGNNWNIYNSSPPSSSDPTPTPLPPDRDVPWRNLGTSMNAISFGFVATAILISMFLIMAIFEHLFKANESSFSSSSPDDDDHHQGSTINGSSQTTVEMQKRQDSQMVLTTSYSSELSVLMPGQQYPTFIAQPAPLPCQREGIFWPPHQQHS